MRVSSAARAAVAEVRVPHRGSRGPALWSGAWSQHIIPASRSLHGPGQPGVAGERAEAAGLGGERVPGRAGGVHDRLVAAREDAVAQPPLAQVEPDSLDRV